MRGVTSSSLELRGNETPGYARPVPLHWWAAADVVVLFVFMTLATILTRPGGDADVGLRSLLEAPAAVAGGARAVRLGPDGRLELSAVVVPGEGATRASFDQDRLDRALARAEELTPVSSLLVQQHGEMVVERYYRGMRADRTTNMKSVSKTLLSPLIGIAIEDGLIEGPDEPLSRLLPEYWSRLEGADAVDARKRDLTLHHVLSMTTGIQSTSFGNYGAWVSSRDWVWDQLRRPIVCRPGCFEYSTGNTHLLSAILTERSGMNLRAYALEKFFRPLGIPLPQWDRDPQGRYLGGNNMALRPLDLLRFGEVFLADGVWEGERLVPADWISRSWRPNATSPWNGHQYGYLWWSDRWGGRDAFFAWGYGGQYLVIVPSLELVAVVTSSLARTQRGHTGRLRDFFDDYLIPAFTE